MLTPVEIQNKNFKSSGLGYDKKDVDVFMQEITDSYESVYREKIELEDKLNSTLEALNHYKNIEKTMQKALILAEKTAEEEKAAALTNARQIENDATTRAQIILSDARRELDSIKQQIIGLKQAFESYKINLKNLAQAQIDLVDSGSFNLTVNDDVLNITSMEPFRPERFDASEEEELPEIQLPEGFDFIDGK